MRKILVIGSGGAGKSTFARRLGQALGIEVIHLDAHYWQPGWVETPKPEWAKTVEHLIERDAWIMDGNYSGTLDLRLRTCDTVIFLDIARLVCLWRVFKRRLIYRRGGRPDMAAGCREQLNLEFVRWIWNYPSRTRLEVLEMLKNRPHVKFVRLRSDAEVERFLAEAQRHQ